MSRFSKAEAEARGWRIFHEGEESTVVTSGTQGESRFTPASYRAEKYVSLPGQSATLVTEEGDSIGKLLERINAYEAELEKKMPELTAREVDLSGEPADEAGVPIRHVLAPTDPGDLSQPASATRVTDAELVASARNDAILTKDGMIFTGPVADVQTALDASIEGKRAVEDRRAAEPAQESEQLHIDETGTAVDSPGGGAQGTILVRAGEDHRDVAGRMAAEAAEREDGRVTTDTTAPEGQEKLAGVDVSIQDRSDLSSDLPRTGDTADASDVTYPAASPSQDGENRGSGSATVTGAARAEAEEEPDADRKAEEEALEQRLEELRAQDKPAEEDPRQP
jgi:hypothetical protein